MNEEEDTRDRFTKWYDRQSFETLFLVGLSPLIFIALVLAIIGFVFGGK